MTDAHTPVASTRAEANEAAEDKIVQILAEVLFLESGETNREQRLGEDEVQRIETLVVATESAVDFSKSAAAFAHRLLGLPPTCRLFEVKQACHSGVAALQVVASSLAAAPERAAKALVIDRAALVPYPFDRRRCWPDAIGPLHTDGEAGARR
jgi:acetyl-CoA acetyltransferase